MEHHNSYEKELAFQADRRKATTEFIQITSDLWYDKSVEVVLFKNQILDRNVSDIIQLHEYAGEFVQKPISIFDSLEILRGINDLNLPPSKLDIGKLTYEFHSDDNSFDDVKAFVIDKLKDAKSTERIEPKDVVLYGFGRLGRLLTRELVAKTGKGNQLRLRAIVAKGTTNSEILEKMARRLRTDAIHGKFMGTVDIDAEHNALIINSTTVYIINTENTEDLDFIRYGISNALAIDSSNTRQTHEGLKKQLRAKGISKVLLTSPGKEAPSIVHGVNHLEYNPDTTHIYSAASYTTNSITPILKVVEDSLGIVKGHLEIIGLTNDQNLLADNSFDNEHNGRATAHNMTIAKTAIDEEVAKVLPALQGKLTSNAIQVQIPNGSLAVLSLEIRNKTSLDGINTILKKYALEGDLVEQIKYSVNPEMVSSDIIGTSAVSVYDSAATIVSSNGKNIVLYVWYDNEYGYTHQVIRLAKHIAKVGRYTYY